MNQQIAITTQTTYNEDGIYKHLTVFLAIFRNSSCLICARWGIIHQLKEGLFSFLGMTKHCTVN